jgi:hypothetical protein
VLDELKIFKSSNSKSFSNLSTNRNLQTDNVRPYPREPPIHRESQPDTQVEDYLHEEGIKYEFSTSYTPQQNGIAEKKE